MFMMSGSEDPIGEWGEGVKRMEQLYRKLGMKHVEMKLVEGDRHELHNEEDRYETFERIAGFMEGVIA